MDPRLSVRLADITTLDIDAIVNAANRSLLGGSGVDGAIHAAAGPQLLAACRSLGGCPTGEARITPGFALPARYVIHTVGPVWHGGTSGEADLLRSCYRSSLALAAEYGIACMAFPAISTGNYRYPADEAARIAVDTVTEIVRQAGRSIEVVFCCFSAADQLRYQRLLGSAESP
ncbi:MAG: O-acetyl-ADP-ribose deacetylase [Chromatiaceae bacterium]|nr:O-acetyl-ADP-ribose deacetylase [Gammaproteobacteria bacterium]MCP5301146.1 O-acetyl-ADP-ribose deacetylase [Chromatiaceae bacterium]MCP5421382.1 O-acetyl-ADP-ribose deacetylase [Chromatiaceae bacterium]